MKFADPAHYFEWVALIERQWRVKVRLNPKTHAVNEKLRVWHLRNPDERVVNLAERRIRRARRQVMGSVR